MFRLAQISDTHLSEDHPEFSANFEVLAAHLRAVRPDLVVNTGDVSAHGELGRDLAFARAKHEGIGLDWLAVPGNHDVGNDPAITPVHGACSESVARWRAVFGPDWWLRDIPGWRLIGLDTLITGAAIPEAAAQLAFLEEALAGAEGRAIALFQHKPICVRRMDEAAPTYWSILAEPRGPIARLLSRNPPRFIASGHVHQWWDRGVCDGLHHIWAPAVAFFVGDTWQEVMGTKVLGYVEHELHPDGTHRYRLVQPEGLTPHDIGLMPRIYGAMPPRED